jgi:hypothetical protein
MSKIDIAKTATKLVVGTSVSFIAKQVIQNNVTPETTVQRAETIVGSLVLGAMIAQAAEKYTDAQIDQLVDGWNKLKTKIAETKAQLEAETP